MIPADKVLAALDKSRELLSVLDKRDIGGFALIFPPEGDKPIEVLLLDSAGDQLSFFKLLADKLAVSREQQLQYGGVRTGGIR